jgi:hypothetical protein
VRIRVLLAAGLSPILRALVRQALDGQADIEIISDPGIGVEALRAWRPDVAVVPTPEGPPSEYEMAIESLPGIRLVEIGGTSSLFVLRRVAINPATTALVEAIRHQYCRG